MAHRRRRDADLERRGALRAGSGTVYDVLRGNLSQLPVGSSGGETCLSQGSSVPSLPSGPAPGLGAGFYYMVRGKNACGVGTYGVTSGGAERISVACPWHRVDIS